MNILWHYGYDVAGKNGSYSGHLWTIKKKRPVTELRVALDRSEAGLIHQLVKGSVEGISRRGETSSTWVQLGLVVGFSGYNMV